MGSRFLWEVTKKTLTLGLFGLTISDRYASFVSVRGLSMHPTLNPIPNTFLGALTDDRVLVTKFCLEKYKFTRGDIIVFCSPNNHKETQVKRIIALPGDWINIPNSYDTMRIPEGHCWVEGDNTSSSMDSRSFGSIPLGLIRGKVNYVVWPPQRVGKLDERMPEGRLLSY